MKNVSSHIKSLLEEVGQKTFQLDETVIDTIDPITDDNFNICCIGVADDFVANCENNYKPIKLGEVVIMTTEGNFFPLSYIKDEDDIEILMDIVEDNYLAAKACRTNDN